MSRIAISLTAPAVTSAQADAFGAAAERQLAELWVDIVRIGRVNATCITDDTDASAGMVECFAPIKAWLDQQNKGKPSGW